MPHCVSVAQLGSNKGLACDLSDSAKPPGNTVPELQAMSRFGLKPLF